jgi:hypothetical protein
VLCPYRPVGSLGSDQCAGVVDDAHAERFLDRPDVALT